MSDGKNYKYRMTKVKEIFPSNFALQAKRKKRSQNFVEGSGPEAEPRAINCPHCGADIPDSGKLTKCLECGSDNLAGVKFPGR